MFQIQKLAPIAINTKLHPGVQLHVSSNIHKNQNLRLTIEMRNESFLFWFDWFYMLFLACCSFLENYFFNSKTLCQSYNITRSFLYHEFLIYYLLAECQPFVTAFILRGCASSVTSLPTLRKDKKKTNLQKYFFKKRSQ